jgi:hypothetical protein
MVEVEKERPPLAAEPSGNRLPKAGYIDTACRGGLRGTSYRLGWRITTDNVAFEERFCKKSFTWRPTDDAVLR